MFANAPQCYILTPRPLTHLKSYSGHRIKCLGSLTLDVHPKSQTMYQKQKFNIIDIPGPAIVGLPACQHLGLVHLDVDSLTNQARAQPDLATLANTRQPVHQMLPPGTKINTVVDLQQWYSDCFDGVGSVHGGEPLYLKEDAEVFIDPPQSCPIHLKDKIKAELLCIEELGIICHIPNNAHTDWCSPLTYGTNNSGSLRVCVDPRKLNKALKWCAHKIPTVEEIPPAFSRAQFFTKLDAKAGYWSVKLAPASQMLTMFRSIIGTSVSRGSLSLFQSVKTYSKSMWTASLTSVKVWSVYVTNLVIFSKTEEQQGQKVLQFFNVASKEGLFLNSAKCIMKKNCITFFGQLYTDQGVLPDANKIEDISKMPRPQDNLDLQRFLSMATCLSSHIPNFSGCKATLRDLLKDGITFDWSRDHQYSFDEIKKLLASSSSLKCYDPMVICCCTSRCLSEGT